MDGMQKLLDCMTKFLKEADWRHMILIKLCVCAAGIMLGMAVPKKLRKYVAFGAIAVFVVTYIPLVLKMLQICPDSKEA